MTGREIVDFILSVIIVGIEASYWQGIICVNFVVHNFITFIKLEVHRLYVGLDFTAIQLECSC